MADAPPFGLKQYRLTTFRRPPLRAGLAPELAAASTPEVISVLTTREQMTRFEQVVYDVFMTTRLATYVCPEPSDRLRYLQSRHAALLIHPMLQHGLLHEIADFTAVAAWQPSTVAVHWAPYCERDRPIARIFEEMETSIMSQVPFYYHLNLLACTKQQQGFATALIQPMLDVADAEGVPCYLESDGATKFYQALGFETMAQALMGDDDDAPMVAFMRRNPQHPPS